MKFRKKAVVIDAEQADGHIMSPEFRAAISFDHEGQPGIQTLEGFMRIAPDDWIIKGVMGEFYPCKPDIFAATYDPVDECERTGRA